MKNGHGQDVWEIIASKSKKENNGCVLWTGVLRGDGYGYILINRIWYRLNRLILSHKLGRPLKPKALACHTCHVRHCIADDHLYEGTPQSNMDDMMKAGRHKQNPPIGERNWKAVLTAEKVRFIRTQKGKASRAHLASQFGCGVDQITAVWGGRYWKHVK